MPRAIFLALLLLAPLAASAGTLAQPLAWPAREDLLRVLAMRDYNTRVVVAGATFLGIASGIVGSFLLLRKRSLLSDAISHATLPGICLAFIAAQLLTGDGKRLPWLLAGAAATGTLGMLAVVGIARATRLKDDAALGIVLSVFFGAGIALMKIATDVPGGNAAGLQSFVYGKTASMLLRDAGLIAASALAVAVASALLFKEFSIVCFDADYASAQGWPVRGLDLAMMALVVAVTVIGLQAVGLILVVALLVIPPAAARFWTDNLKGMVVVAAAIGGIGGFVGSALSALMGALPAGAVIVLASAAMFGTSMLFGPARGVLPQVLRRRRLAARIGRQHVLRAIYEGAEDSGDAMQPVAFEDLIRARSWTPAQLRRHLHAARREGAVESPDGSEWRLTDAGRSEAARVIRNHRLWEMYLISHADIAPSHVDRDADAIEHVLSDEMVQKLEGMLIDGEVRDEFVPPNPHAQGVAR